MGGETHQPGWTRNCPEMSYKVRAKRNPSSRGEESEHMREKQKMEEIK